MRMNRIHFNVCTSISVHNNQSSEPGVFAIRENEHVLIIQNFSFSSTHGSAEPEVTPSGMVCERINGSLWPVVVHACSREREERENACIAT